MISEQIQESIAVKQQILVDKGILEQISQMAEICTNTLKHGGKIILAGNGGSFADAQHIAAEFISRYMIERHSLPSVALGCNNSVLSAVGNDYGYQEVFARELSSLANDGDCFIPISTSGNSENILRAIVTANEKNIVTYGLSGVDGGKMADLCKTIRVPSKVTGRIQESHILIGHIVCSIVENNLFGDQH